jgi:hypothetical protein
MCHAVDAATIDTAAAPLPAYLKRLLPVTACGSSMRPKPGSLAVSSCQLQKSQFAPLFVESRNSEPWQCAVAVVLVQVAVHMRGIWCTCRQRCSVAAKTHCAWPRCTPYHGSMQHAQQQRQRLQKGVMWVHLHKLASNTCCELRVLCPHACILLQRAACAVKHTCVNV